MTTPDSTTKSGIYIIFNTINGHFYIGQSQNMRRRWYGHCSCLRRNCHDNKHLQSAWNKYGESAFMFTVLEYVSIEHLNEREQMWLNAHLDNNCYNISHDTEVPNRGIKRDEEYRNKQRQAHRGKHHSEETRRKMSEAHQGEKHHYFDKHLSEDHRRKMSEAHLGKPGHPCSEETKRKISEAERGKPRKPHNNETRRKISEGNRGKRHTEESRRKMSETKKRRNAERRQSKAPESNCPNNTTDAL